MKKNSVSVGAWRAKARAQKRKLTIGMDSRAAIREQNYLNSPVVKRSYTRRGSGQLSAASFVAGPPTAGAPGLMAER